MKLVYRYPNFKYIYEVTEQNGTFIATLLGLNPKQTPLATFDDIFDLMSDRIAQLLSCLGRPKVDNLSSDGNSIRFRYNASNQDMYAEIRVVFGPDRIFAQCIVNREQICGKNVLDEFKKIVSTAISMSVEI